MEIDVTRFVSEAEPFEFSASIAERGKNVARETWDAAVCEADERPLLSTNDEVETTRDWFGEFGAWDDDDRAAWSPAEVNALLIQYISGDLREAQSLAPGDGPGGIDWDDYKKLQQEGTCSGYLGRGGNDRVYFGIY